MQLDGDLHCGFQRCHQLGGLVRQQQTGHILDTDGVSAHLLNLLGHAGPVLQGVSVSQGVGQRHLSVSSLLIGCGYCGLQVAQIVQTVENTDDINTVGDGFLYKVLHHVVGVGTVAQDVLSAEEHLQLGILEALPELSQSVPGIFLQETQGSVEGGSSPALHRMITHFIQLFYDGQHLLCGHTGRNQRLVRVSQNSLSNFNRFFYHI